MTAAINLQNTYYRPVLGLDLNLLAQGQAYQSAIGVSAAGTTRTDATQLNDYALTNVSTTAASTGVNLPSAQGNQWIMLANSGANTLTVYALGSDTINGTAGATGVTMSTGQAALYFSPTIGKWYRVLTA